MWDRRSHLLHPLMALTSPKVKFKWTHVEQKEFDEIKSTVSHDNLLAYPDSNKQFDIQTDSRNHQLGAVIIHDSKSIAFCSRKLTETQKHYAVTEKEFLSIVETLKEFRTILLGQKLKIYTDHKNITCKNFNKDCALR